MREQKETLESLGATVAVITWEPPEVVRRFQWVTTLPFRVLSDPDRRAYAAFGLQRGRSRQIWNWETSKVYMRAALRGRLPRLPHGHDIAQLGGDFVLNREGYVVFIHRSRSPADRPSIEAVLDAVRSAAR